MTRKIEEDLRINDPLEEEFGVQNSEFGIDDEDEENLGIRPMEPLQPSKFRRENARKRATGERREKGSRHDVRKEIPASAGMTSSLEDLERQMKEAAARLDFEEAARLRDIIRNMR